MNLFRKLSTTALFLFILTQVCLSQETVTPKLVWEVNKIDLGTILEEKGHQVAEFRFTHTQDSLFWIDRVWTDCGCTTVDYTEDTLNVGQEGVLRISYDPSSSAGFFSRMVVVKGNLMGTQDTLFIEGTAVPFPENPETDYPNQQLGFGFRQQKINMGEVFTNEPKIKNVEFYNFNDETIYTDSMRVFGPSHIQLRMKEDSIQTNERGLIQVIYSGTEKDDLGFFEDPVQFSWSDSLVVQWDVIANVLEYFPAFSKDQLGIIPNLSISPKEIDLKKIESDQIQNEVVLLTNKGQEVLEIRKIQGNCSCLKLTMSQMTINPGESVELHLEFDPKGRQGIDQRNIFVFSNDPLNPVQGIILKSRID